MTRRSYTKAIDDTLRPYGFERSGDNWIRVRGDIEECVNRQAGRFGVTLNLFMTDLETEKLLEIVRPDKALILPPVNQRIGLLIDGRDRWWRSDEPEGPRELADALASYGLPSFDKVRTLEQQAEHWYGRQTAFSAKGYRGQSLAALALTLYRMGELEEACQILSKPVTRRAFPGSIAWVANTRRWLRCDAPLTAQSVRG